MNHRRQFEYGQEHANDDAADHDSQKDDQKGLDQRGQGRNRGSDLLVVVLGDLVQHGFDLSGLFADLDHLYDHRGKNTFLPHGLSNVFPLADTLHRPIHGVGIHLVVHHALDDFQGPQNGHAAAQKHRKRIGKPGDRDLANQ